MNRLAVFAEGHTEVLFVEKLLDEIAGQNKVLIEHREVRGGSATRRTMKLIKAAKPNTGQKYYVLLLDCGGDESVKTRIMEEHENLTNKGYSGLIGIRDVRPRFTHNDIPKLEASLPRYIRTSLAPVTFILAIMEIEAWFLAEATHFPKIESSITVAAIKASLGFDPENDSMEQRLCPADDLKACYAIGGKSYVKQQAKTTVDALDYALVYMVLRRKIAYLDRLISVIDAFLA
ncbi:MAG: hypothetical protein FJ118_20735 [Deltaproteobacteria bacterium]|nr:hypothetical protein [Deltaproteobacteria bacterium]